MPMLGGGIDSERVAKWFVLAAVFNALMALVFLAPFLIPAPGGATSDLFSLSFAIGSFPGTWMLIAWIVFLIVGVLGMAGWGFIYYLHSKLWGRRSANKLFSLGHLGLTIAGVYVATIFLFLAGFIGGRATLPPTGCYVLIEGCLNTGIAVVSTLIAWTVIPSAIGMVIGGLGTLMGFLNIILISRQG